MDPKDEELEIDPALEPDEEGDELSAILNAGSEEEEKPEDKPEDKPPAAGGLDYDRLAAVLGGAADRQAAAADKQSALLQSVIERLSSTPKNEPTLTKEEREARKLEIQRLLLEDPEQAAAMLAGPLIEKRVQEILGQLLPRAQGALESGGELYIERFLSKKEKSLPPKGYELVEKEFESLVNDKHRAALLTATAAERKDFLEGVWERALGRHTAKAWQKRGGSARNIGGGGNAASPGNAAALEMLKQFRREDRDELIGLASRQAAKKHARGTPEFNKLRAKILEDAIREANG